MTVLGRIGLFLFIAVQSPFLIFYLVLLIDKLKRPGFKNLNWDELVWMGATFVVLIFIDVWIIKKICTRTEK